MRNFINWSIHKLKLTFNIREIK